MPTTTRTCIQMLSQLTAVLRLKRETFSHAGVICLVAAPSGVMPCGVNSVSSQRHTGVNPGLRLSHKKGRCGGWAHTRFKGCQAISSKKGWI